MLGQRHMVENIFFLSLAGFLLEKIFDLPTFYPAFGILGAFFFGDLFSLLKDKKIYVGLWLALAFYAFAVLPVPSHNLVAVAFFLTPLYAFSLISLIKKYPLNREYLTSGIYWFSLAALALLAVGLVHNFDEIAKHSSWYNISLELRRGDVSLRNALFKSFIPWQENDLKPRVLISVLGILLTVMAIIKPISRRGVIAISLLFFLNLIAMARGPIVAATILLVLSFAVKSKRAAIFSTSLCILFPLLIFNFSDRFLNGRKPIWDSLMHGLDWIGHGLGAAASASTAVSKFHNQYPVIRYPHNLHFELIYDWGLIAYGFFLAAALTYFFKQQRPRTAFMIFVVLSVTYTIYSPWVTWLLIFAVWQDQQQMAFKLDLSLATEVPKPVHFSWPVSEVASTSKSEASSSSITVSSTSASEKSFLLNQ